MFAAMEHHDVIIAGAGPAGSTASWFLSKAGIPHLLIDKAQFPRDKVCGDALSGKVTDMFRRMDPKWIEELVAEKTEVITSFGIIFGSPNGKTVAFPFLPPGTDSYDVHKPPGLLATRVHFDHFLVNKAKEAGATLWENTELVSANYADGKWHLELQSPEGSKWLTASILLDGCGDRSVLTKHIYRNEPDHYCGGIRAYYTGVNGLNPNGFIELHFIPELLPGYLWVFPMANGRANVGAGMLSSALIKNKVNLREAMLHALATHPNFKDRFASAKVDGKIMGWGLPLGSKRRKLHGDGLLLLGDAGGIIDPFTGEGIGNAMISGMVASRAVVACRDKNLSYSAENLEWYTNEFYRKMGAELRISRILQRLCNWRWLFNFVVRKANRSKTFRESIMSMFYDMNMRKRLSNPLFYVKLLLNR